MAKAVRSKDAVKTRIGSRDEGSWRPSSIFGGLFAVAPVLKESVEGEEEEEAEGTLKARPSAESTRDVVTSSGSNRLSTMFTDWMLPATPVTASVTLVSQPIGLMEGGKVAQRFATISGSRRGARLPEEEPPASDNLEEAFDGLMVSQRLIWGGSQLISIL